MKCPLFSLLMFDILIESSTEMWWQVVSHFWIMSPVEKDPIEVEILFMFMTPSSRLITWSAFIQREESEGLSSLIRAHVLIVYCVSRKGREYVKYIMLSALIVPSLLSFCQWMCNSCTFAFFPFREGDTFATGFSCIWNSSFSWQDINQEKREKRDRAVLLEVNTTQV